MTIKLIFWTAPLFQFMHLADEQDIITALKNHNAYVTQTRIAVLKVLSKSQTSISVSRIRKLSPVALDRVSVYRALQLFLRKGLIRTIPNSKGNPQYILSNFLKPPTLTSASDQLVYFVCNHCGYTELIQQNAALKFTKPDKYQVKNWFIVLEGVCTKCMPAK